MPLGRGRFAVRRIRLSVDRSSSWFQALARNERLLEAAFVDAARSGADLLSVHMQTGYPHELNTGSWTAQQIEAMAKALVERETLDAEEIQACLENKPLPDREHDVSRTGLIDFFAAGGVDGAGAREPVRGHDRGGGRTGRHRPSEDRVEDLRAVEAQTAFQARLFKH